MSRRVHIVSTFLIIMYLSLTIGCGNAEISVLTSKLETMKKELQDSETAETELEQQVQTCNKQLHELGKTLGQEKKKATEASSKLTLLDKEHANTMNSFSKCSKELGLKRTAEKKLLEQVDELNGQVTKANQRAEAANKKLNSLQMKLNKLKETDQYIYNKAVEAMDNLEIESAISAIDELQARFPTSKLVKPAKMQLKKAKEEYVNKQLQTIAGSLSPSDKRSYALAFRQLEELNKLGVDRKKIARLKDKVAEVIVTWPIPVDKIESLKLQYADLRGRKGMLPEVAAKASTYYNCRYKSSSKWRSFMIADERTSMGMHVYCRRGDDKCDGLFRIATSEAVLLKSVVVQYPRSNSVCEEAQAELVSWE